MPPPLDVLIIGAGPTGLTAAHELARRGVACRIVDKKPAPVAYSQALAVQVRTLETLDLMGIVDGWLAAGYPLRRLVPRAFGKRLPDVDLAGVESRFDAPLSVGQQDTERLLTAALERHGLHVERHVEALAIAQDDVGVDVTLRTAAGATESVRARWVVDCEGSHSMSREALGIAFEGARNPHREMIQADAQVASCYPAGVIHFFIDTDRAVALFPFDADGHCRILCIIPPSDPPRHDPPTLDDVQAEVRRVADPLAVLSDPRWLNRFRTQHRLAAAFRKERVFLAGDTAHVHVPVGGQGMNYGIQDAFNLAWKLAGVARGELSPWILETYEMERRPAAAELVEATERVFHAVAPAGGAGHVRQTLLPLVAGAALHLDHVQQLARDLMAEFNVHYRESPLSETHGGGHLIAGERVPDVRIVRADRATTSLDALLRQRGWLLLALDGRRPLDAKLLDACAAALPPHLQLLRVHTAAPSAASPPDPADLFDVDETLHDTLGVKHPALYLLRPDGYIGFCADLDRRAPDRLRGFLQRVMRTPPPLTASPE